MNVRFLLFMVLMFSTFASGYVTISTTPRGVEAKAHWQVAGTIRFELDEEWDLYNVTSEQPVFVRLRFFGYTVLAQTLVDIGAPGSRHKPIRLALFLTGSKTDKLIAPENAVEIVRWRAGESELWLRLNAHPNIERDGEIVPPDDEVRVAFVMGNMKGLSQQQVSQLYETGRANLPCNSLDDGTPVHTLFVLDTTDTPLNLNGTENQIQFDIIAYDWQTRNVSTAEDPSGILSGDDPGSVYFQGDNLLAILNPNPSARRRISHVPTSDSPYRAWIHLSNPTDEPEAFNLIGYGFEGIANQVWSTILEPKSVATHSISELFPDAAESFLEVLANDSSTVTMDLETRRGEVLTSVKAGSEKTRRFLIRRHSFHDGQTFDGLAAVNLGDFWDEMELSLFDNQNTLIGTISPGAFDSMHKQLLLLDDIYRLHPDTHYLVGQTQLPVSLIMFHGSTPGIRPAFLRKIEVATISIEELSESLILKIPDPNFKAFLLNEFDFFEKDGEISLSEAIHVTKINCSSQNIQSLSGIEQFHNLQKLSCSNNPLTTLPDLSGLTKLDIIYCNNASLTRLPRLPHSLKYLYVVRNQLTSLPNLPEDLRLLSAPSNLITEINTDLRLPNAIAIYLRGNQLTSLPDLSSMSKLEIFWCQNNQLTSLPDVSNLKRLKDLRCENNQIKSLPGLSHLNSLETLWCDHNQITTLPDVSNLVELQDFFCHDNLLERLPNVWDIPNSRLEIFDCSGNYFDEDDCDDINAVEAMDISCFFWNPQAGGTEISCP